MKIEKKCLRCGTTFITETKYLKRGHGKYCTQDCAHKSRTKKVHKPNNICAQCGNHFYRQQSHLLKSKSGLFFCGRECKNKAQRIDGMREIHPAHYNGSAVYRDRALRLHKHICVGCGYRKSIKVLLVHHINWSRKNNEVTNLAVVCPTCHKEIHLGIRTKQSPFSYV